MDATWSPQGNKEFNPEDIDIWGQIGTPNKRAAPKGVDYDSFEGG